MNAWPIVLCAACAGALLGACGGSTASISSDASTGDAAHDGSSPADAGADGCPPGTPAIPDAAIYACDAEAPDASGCPAAPGDPNHAKDHNVYPLDCVVTLPVPAGFCGDACCGPQTCNCSPTPNQGPVFLCPL